jgi:hypothetical protein
MLIDPEPVLRSIAIAGATAAYGHYAGRVITCSAMITTTMMTTIRATIRRRLTIGCGSACTRGATDNE